MSKIKTLFKGLKAANDALSVLDQFVDVDRLIGISNAQGPQAKLIRAILELDPDDPLLQTLFDQTKPVKAPLITTPLQAGSSKKKKLPKRTSPT